MSDLSVISKGKYDAPQTGNAIPVDSYLFVRENGKKYLLLKFNNPRKDRLTGVDLQITMLNARGKELGTKQASFNDLNAKPRKDFVLTHKIEVEEECADCRVTTVSARYGAYSYSVEKSTEQVDYIAAKSDKFDVGNAIDNLGWESAVVTERTLKNRILIAIISCVLIVAVLVFTVLQLNLFTAGQETFSYSGVEYAFADGDRSSESDVYAVGLLGVKSNVTVPEEIEGHRVAKISANAFSGNARLRSITVEGEIEIENSAFANCKNLETVSLEKVTGIGKEAFLNCEKLSSFTAGNLDLINDGAFKNCASLKSVSISNEKKPLTLGNRVFERCGSLETLEIAQQLIYPQETAVLRDCYKISTLTLNNFSTDGGKRTLVSLFGSGYRLGQSLSLQTVKIGSLDRISENFLSYTPVQSVTVTSLERSEISNYAFFQCTALSELNLPLSPTAVGDYAFSGARLTAFDWKEVTSIGVYAFSETAVTSLDATNLNFLGSYAFERSALTSVTLPQTLRLISEYAFSGCSLLTSFNVPETVSEIGRGAVNSCSRLESLTVPYIGGSLFANNYLGYIFGADSYTKSERFIPQSLKTVTVTGGSGIPDFAFFGAASVQRINLPDKTAKIGEYSFADCRSLANINLTEPLTSIGIYAFSNCVSLTSLTVPDTVTSIGTYAFSGCNRLETLTVPFVGCGAGSDNKLKNIFDRVPQTLNSVTVTCAEEIGDYAFEGCTALKKAVLPENLKRIGEYAFVNCGLTEITIPETVTSIGEYAFANCRQLQKIVIPASVNRIGERTTFDGCRTLWEIWNFSDCPVWAMNAVVYDKEDLQLQRFFIGGYEFGYSLVDREYKLLSYPKTTQNLQLPYGFTYRDEAVEGYAIPAYLFCEDGNIVSVKLPDCITRLGEYAFAECVNLETVEFAGAKFTEIENNAFEKCSGLKSIIIPDTVAKIGNNAFYACTSLESVKFGSGLKSIGGSAFQYCNSLKEVNLPEGLTTVTTNAFYGCAALQSVTLPQTLDRIDGDAFGSCGKLKLVFNYSGINLVKGGWSYGGVAQNALYIVTADDEADCAGYYNVGGVNYLHYYDEWTAVWCENGVTEIVLEEFTYNGKQVAAFNVLSNAFANESALKKVTVGSAVKELGEYAFAYCYALESLELAHGITAVSNGAFIGCQSLSYVKIPTSVTVIGESAFASCTGIVSVDLSEKLNSVGAFAFAGCNGLTEIIIPANVKEIGEYAFNGCNRLYVVYNLSALDITERSASNGRVAYYALAVFKNLNDKAEFTTVDEFEFVKIYGVWYLFRCNGGGFIRLPDKVTASETAYTVKNYAFETSVYAVVMSEAVNKIEEYAFGNNYYFTVYYPGTEEEWIKLRPETLEYTFCYHYVDCVHNEREWTFIDGSVSTQPGYYGYDWTVTKQPTCAEEGTETGVCSHCKQHTVTNSLPKTDNHEYDWTVTKQPTCTEDGIETGTCKICGVVITRPVEKSGHDFDEHGECKNCGCTVEQHPDGSERRS